MERAGRHEGLWGGIARYARENPTIIEDVYREIADRGPWRSRSLKSVAAARGHGGAGMIPRSRSNSSSGADASRRQGCERFTRIYDLPERVLPPEILAAPAMDEASAHRLLMEIAARSHGIGTEACLRDYFRLSPGDARPALASLVEEGVVDLVEVEGWKRPVYLHREADLPARAKCAALLAPFDSLVFNRDRAEALFGFRYRIEILCAQGEAPARLLCAALPDG